MKVKTKDLKVHSFPEFEDKDQWIISTSGSVFYHISHLAYLTDCELAINVIEVIEEEDIEERKFQPFGKCKEYYVEYKEILIADTLEEIKKEYDKMKEMERNENAKGERLLNDLEKWLNDNDEFELADKVKENIDKFPNVSRFAGRVRWNDSAYTVRDIARVVSIVRSGWITLTMDNGVDYQLNLSRVIKAYACSCGGKNCVILHLDNDKKINIYRDDSRYCYDTLKAIFNL